MNLKRKVIYCGYTYGGYNAAFPFICSLSRKHRLYTAYRARKEAPTKVTIIFSVTGVLSFRFPLSAERGKKTRSTNGNDSSGEQSRARSSILPVPILLSTAGILVRSLTFENEAPPWMCCLGQRAGAQKLLPRRPLLVFAFAFRFFHAAIFTFVDSLGLYAR